MGSEKVERESCRSDRVGRERGSERERERGEGKEIEVEKKGE